MRLIAGERASGGRLACGVEIVLSKGFKTYWRNPGDSGIPPTFDWSASDNVADVEVRWPAPSLFADPAGHSIGYHDEVVFPLLVRPTDAGRPVVLRLALDYAVCEKICIPASGKAELALTTLPGTPHLERLELFERRVPEKRTLGEGGDLAIGAITSKGGDAFTVLASVPDAARDAALFVDGPEGWFFKIPVADPSLSPIHGAAGRPVAFQVGIAERPQDAKAAQIVLTLTIGERAIEVRAPLDLGERAP